MSIQRAVLIAGCVAAAVLTPSSLIRAQTYPTSITLTVRSWDPDSTCSTGAPCHEDTGEPDLGTYEFRVYGGVEETIEEAWFSLQWPDTWSLVDSDVCQDSLVSGSLDSPELGFHFRSPSCFDRNLPLFWFALDCDAPGEMRLQAHPDIAEGLAAKYCGQPGLQPNYDRTVVVGDFCGRLEQPSCGFCFPDLAGYFTPSSLQVTLPSGQVFADTIRVFSPDDCSDIPECQALPTPCFDRVEPASTWITAEFVDQDGPDRRYRITIDPQGLALGTHETRIWLDGMSDCCRNTCMPVVLDLVPPEPVLPTTWGRLKSRY
jgi:hypothetical protein